MALEEQLFFLLKRRSNKAPVCHPTAALGLKLVKFVTMIIMM